MSSRALSADDIEEMTGRVLGSRKYASMNLPPETVKDLIHQEIAAGKSPKEVEKAMREKAMNLLEIVGLADVANELATSLPYGKQRRLEIARALATDPTLLLLDEPAAGMNPQETDELGEFIVDIKNQFNLTVFMIEHHMNLVMDISDRIYVLDFGKQIAEGTPEEIQKNPVVIAAYLGVDEE